MKPPEWILGRVGDLIQDLVAGVSVNGDRYPAREREIGVLKISAVTDGVFKPTENKRVLASDLSRVKASASAGTILVSRSNTESLVGASAYVATDHPNLYLSDKLWKLVTKDEVVLAKWLSFFLSAERTRSALSAAASGTSGSMKNIKRQALLDLPIYIPPILEQRKMADVLACWDQAITLTQQLIQTAEMRRRALSQRLLKGAARFPSCVRSRATVVSRYGSVPVDWQFVRIGDIASQISERHENGLHRPVLSCSKYQGFVSSLEYFKKKVYSQDLSNYKVVKRGDFAFPANHIEEGSIGYQDIVDCGIVSPIYVVFRINENVDGGYLYKLLKTEHYRQIFAATTNASVDRRGSLRWKEFQNIRIALPAIEEQKAISRTIDVAQREIDNLRRQLQALRDTRAGLIQQLFSGKRRVKLDPTTALELAL